ncbi:hypothetical protein QA600_20695 [Natronococcus sp. A-GB1]|uniref:hypothetical protein n=1 Tax=Natronococcus sp. A-GB1 TaxID=3037648 RepID=UPI00241EB506|nr:hypothetical protein [Natronococcus sp. A-GB1]MDG5761744.1 hypothetical protein [Natronococcus sp. A-GB1]
MATYNPIERSVARLLEQHPTLKSRIKRYYQRSNYHLFRERGFEATAHPDATVRTLAETFDCPPLSGEVFFGYFDKVPWSPSGERAVVHRVQDDRSTAEIVVLADGERTVIDETPLWNYQQGAMTQWLPGPDATLIYNDLVDGEYGSRIVTPSGRPVRELTTPIQTVHPDGSQALSLNYRRLAAVRPEYGYTPPSERFDAELPPTRDGLWWLDLETDESELLVDLERLRRNQPRPEMADATHWVNHALYAPGGARFVFMHRWEGDDGRFSRLYLGDRSGSLDLLLDTRIVSHYCWLDEDSLVVWGQGPEGETGYYRVDVTEHTVEPFGDAELNRYGDGHPSISPNERVVVTDTYPDRARQRHLLLYDRVREETATLGRFLAPLEYEGETRCDLHPRWDRTGEAISIDSAHEGSRNTYVVEFGSET